MHILRLTPFLCGVLALSRVLSLYRHAVRWSGVNGISPKVGFGFQRVTFRPFFAFGQFSVC